MPSSSLVEFLLEHNARQSEAFCSPDARLWRKQYRSRHPTEIAALKCMDGRLNLAIMSNTPPGIIQPFRNIAGKFDIGWPYFGELLEDWVNYSMSMGRDCLILVTHHWSKGERHRGCRGFEYDTGSAANYTHELKAQIERVFGSGHVVVYPIRLGIETDEDAFVLYGNNGDYLNLAQLGQTLPEDLQLRVQALYPDMKPQMVNDLLPLLLGNLEHIANVRREQRPIEEAHHQEQVLAVGRGFDWLHLPNKALIIGPYTYDLAEPVATAAGILLSNLQEERVPANEGFVLMTSAVYRDEAGSQRFRAIEKTLSLARFAETTISRTVPQLRERLAILPGIVNLNTRRFTQIPFNVEPAAHHTTAVSSATAI
ncbi:MAG: hypothetical protein WC734_02855 [Patescibacteria group bacterium]|jgi:hypothetical protein